MTQSEFKSFSVATRRAHARLRLIVVAFLASACGFDDAEGGCGDSITNNPRFDRWCGDQLCNWVTLTGAESIRRVPTWHEHDFGVELVGTPTVITQLRYISAPECLEVSLVADVDASANVSVGLDYNFDGDPTNPSDEADVALDVAVDEEFEVPRAHWQRFTFLFSTPVRYSGVRFVIRKRGEGRAVLAEVRVQASDECTTARLPAVDSPRGVPCEQVSECVENATHCASVVPTDLVLSLCRTVAPDWYCEGEWRAHCGEVTPDEDCTNVSWVDWCSAHLEPTEQRATLCVAEAEPMHPSTPPTDAVSGVCSECSTHEDCAQGEVCGLATDPHGAYRACKPAGEVGEPCVDGSECASEMCGYLASYGFFYASCADCDEDSDCAEGLVCGLDSAVQARRCVIPADKPLSSLCEADSECISGVCCAGRCSQCCDDAPGTCDGECTSVLSFSSDDQPRDTPFLCLGLPPQPAGAECVGNEACVSGVCEGAVDVCKSQQTCIGDACDDAPDPDCTLITIAGQCQ